MPLPEYGGARYSAWVPDTLDLADRASLAIHAIAGTTEPANDYAQYFLVTLASYPPTMIRHQPVGSDTAAYNPKMWEALILDRLTCGNCDHGDMERSWADRLWNSLTTDNLSTAVSSGRMLATATLYWLLTGDDAWKKACARAVRDYRTILVEHQTRGEMGRGWPATIFGWTLQGLSQYLRATGDDAAYETATRLARYLSDPRTGVLDEEGRLCARHGPRALEHQTSKSIWDPQAGTWPDGSRMALHFHHNTNTVLALAEYALATGDKEAAARALRAYEFARSTGSPITGYYPEYIGDVWPDDRPFRNTEGCCIADMVAIQSRLTQTGAADLFDDLDATLRNELATMQMLRGDWMYRVAERLISAQDTVVPRTERATEENATSDRVPERNVGSFGGWTLPNDLWAGKGWPVFQHCCLGNCARALYYGWESILEHCQDTLHLHLLLNRASPWADVNSHLPYQGRVDVRMKARLSLRVRLPVWVGEKEGVTVTVNGTATTHRRSGRYVELDAIPEGQTATLQFPITERTVQEKMGGELYSLGLRGSDIVWIEPRGIYYPLFEREALRNDRTRWVDKERFVADQSVLW
ncbi:MAG: glycoside hydrolase family 127 protein [Candidatus Latescibacteria bacterium]|nr:glycoside hydrolase family 127 protein [Candidatus Latescibacterota bacterium]